MHHREEPGTPTFHSTDARGRLAGEDRTTRARNVVLATLLVIVLLAAYGLAGTMDYEDRVSALYPATMEETR